MVFSTINPFIAFGVVVTTVSRTLLTLCSRPRSWGESEYLPRHGAAFYICSHHLKLLITRTIGSTSSLRLSDLGLAC
jgi:hypothetical protein